MVKGIDVSEWQGVIDWDKVKAAGIQFAIIRTGWGKTGVDKQFKRNVSEARRVGIKVGLYHYSYATSVYAAQAEAAHVINLIKGMTYQSTSILKSLTCSRMQLLLLQLSM